MDPEIKRLLVKNLEVSEENNKILRSMRRTARFGTAFRVFYWLLIIGSSIGAYLWIQPYIDSLMGTYTKAAGQLNSIGESAQKLNSYLPK